MESYRYMQQYAEALSQLGRTSLGWPLLAKSLSGENAEQVSVLLNEYVIAFLSREAAKQSYERAGFSTGTIEEVHAVWAHINLLRIDAEFALRQQEKSYRKLMIAMLGQEVVDREGLACIQAETESESEDDE